jgi:hypothetical protein
MHISNWCVLWKFANGAENRVLQWLQFHYMSICREFPDGRGINHYRSNESFTEGQFKASA